MDLVIFFILTLLLDWMVWIKEYHLGCEIAGLTSVIVFIKILFVFINRKRDMNRQIKENDSR